VLGSFSQVLGLGARSNCGATSALHELIFAFGLKVGLNLGLGGFQVTIGHSEMLPFVPRVAWQPYRSYALLPCCLAAFANFLL
jgi:hypothetical protein